MRLRSVAKKISVIFGVVLIATSCGTRSKSDSSGESCIASGDIVVSNSGSDAVLVLDAAGNFKAVAYNVVNTAETVYGLHWNADSGELLVAVDGADRVVAVRSSDCGSRDVVLDGNLSGNLRGVTRLASGDILVVETSAIERFSWNGIRVATGGWPRTLQTTSTGISAIPSGGFVLCSTGADVVRTYDDTGTQIATRASGIAATTDAADCMVLADGSIATVWSGTTDTVSIYSSDLSANPVNFSNLGILSTPGGVAQRANGNLLILDRVLNWIVEISPSGVLVGTLGDAVLSTPEFILVVP